MLPAKIKKHEQSEFKYHVRRLSGLSGSTDGLTPETTEGATLGFLTQEARQITAARNKTE